MKREEAIFNWVYCSFCLGWCSSMLVFRDLMGLSYTEAVGIIGVALLLLLVLLFYFVPWVIRRIEAGGKDATSE